MYLFSLLNEIVHYLFICDLKFWKSVWLHCIVDIDNFKIKSGICEIQYDYANDTIKQPDEKVIPFATKALIVLLVIIVVTGLIAYIKQRR